MPKFLFRISAILILSYIFLFGFSLNSHAVSIYWGAYISGSAYNLSTNPPWDTTAWDTFESHTNKKISVFHWGLPWYNSVSWPQGYYPFIPSLFDTVRNRGAIPFIDWGSWDLGLVSKTNQPNFSLSTIIQGNHDTYITQWATAAKNWGHPFFLRFGWEMNGNWFPWSESVNGNSQGQFILAWKHIHDIFTAVGATNVTWVWCPNTQYPNSQPLNELYPGENYVDWTCIDVYNWGTNNPTHPEVWQSFYQLFKSTYDAVINVAPSKPIIIGETASSEFGGSKPAWIADFLSNQLPNNFPKVQGFLWFNWNTDNADWIIETSTASEQAFATGISSSYYAANNFANLNISPIPPLTLSSPSPTPSSSPIYNLNDLKYILNHYTETINQYFLDGKLNILDAAFVIRFF